MANTPVEIRIKPGKKPGDPIRVRLTQVDAGGRYTLAARQMTLDEALEELVSEYEERAARLGLGDSLTPPLSLPPTKPNGGVD